MVIVAGLGEGVARAPMVTDGLRRGGRVEGKADGSGRLGAVSDMWMAAVSDGDTTGLTSDGSGTEQGSSVRVISGGGDGGSASDE